MSAPAVTSLCVVISVSTSPGLKTHRPAADGSRPATDCACQTMSNRSRSRHGPPVAQRAFPPLFTADFFRYPYAAYSALRERDPVHWDEEHQVWVVTRYADVAAALANPRLVRGTGDVTVETDDPLRRVLSRMMLFSEP